MARNWPDAGVINVEYRNIDGHHVFTSEEVDGLYVASVDPRRAFDDLRNAIKMLVQMNDGVRIELEPMLNWRDFLAHTRKAGDGVPEPFTMGRQQFRVQIAA